MTRDAKLDPTRPIIGVENRTAQEVFDIMCDRLRATAPIAQGGDAGPDVAVRDPDLRKRCVALASRLARDAMLRQGSPPDTIAAFVEDEIEAAMMHDAFHGPIDTPPPDAGVREAALEEAAQACDSIAKQRLRQSKAPDISEAIADQLVEMANESTDNANAIRRLKGYVRDADGNLVRALATPVEGVPSTVKENQP